MMAAENSNLVQRLRAALARRARAERGIVRTFLSSQGCRAARREMREAIQEQARVAALIRASVGVLA